ncbi:bifunctional adenosylcobinamide kinase/adenosylcobinamide-phosphate guanylyltransferase [Oceaniglobus trochenteri]|uniref:bifunctional adenosylcobinamide kinase/adenosylcobinamide-phosphate guanylyltransferase n=1 Tax=Oceaniglobus trochenteri TaxID=2763260 RepID=UPI001CFFE6A7|nr:bifunctional adenosylcobinamide kinase/adenosylcobinamide-phosphate guanylyltransferase [Oceaniglobus trochenteri]
MLPNLSLVLGGASSGKSDLAERLVALVPLRRVYIATAQTYDDEMRAKIAAHQAARGPGWHTIEAPLDLAAPLAGLGEGDIVLIDCATLWLSNHLIAGSDPETITTALQNALAQAPCPVVVVSNEVGQGIVPENALARRFRNAQGRLNRNLAAQADLVVAVMAGLPLALKGDLPEGLA